MGEMNSRIWPSRKLLLFFLLGFLGGVAFTGLFGRDFMDYAGILSEYYLNRYQYTEIITEQLFFYLLRERMAPVVVLLFLTFTPLSAACAYLFFGWQGFSLGTVLTLSIWKFGGRGVLLCLAGMLPQYLFYIPAWVLLGLFLCMRRREGSGELFRYKGTGGGRVGNLILFFLIFLLLVAGIVSEAWINPGILLKILSLF